MGQVRAHIDREAVHRDPARDPDPDGADLPVPGSSTFMLLATDPGARGRRIAVSIDPEVPEGVHRPLLEPAQVSMQSKVQRVEVEDRVGHQLAGAVIGDIASSIRLLDRHAGRFQPSGIGQEVITGPRTTGHRDDRRVMFHQQQVTQGPPLRPGRDDLRLPLPLDLQGLAVGQSPQVGDDQ